MTRYVLFGCLVGFLIALAQEFIGLTNGGGIALALITVAVLIRHRIRSERKGGEA